MMIGGFFDRNHEGWDSGEMDWFESFLEEQDVDIMAWGIGTQSPPERYAGPMMHAFQTLDYIEHHK